MNNLRLVLAALLVAGCGGRGFYAHAPIASAALVHSCAIAEVDFQLKKAGGSMDRALGIDMEAGGEAGPNVEVDVGGVVPGYEAKASSAKKLTFKVDTIPSLEACLAWGYLPQLGVDGCLPSRNCKAAAVEELRTALGDEKAIRLQAASDLSCIADSIQVNVLNFSGMSGTYEAAGCGKAARYTVNTTVVAPAGGGQPGPSTEKREVTKSPGIADNRE